MSRTGVLLALLGILPVPLTNARSASVGEDDTSSLLELLGETVTGDGGTDLLGSGGDGELALEVETVVERLLDDVGRAGHVLVGGVGARADETDTDIVGPAVLLGLLSELGDGGSEIGGEGAVDVGLQLGEVLRVTSCQKWVNGRNAASSTHNLDDLVVLGALVSPEVVLELGGVVGDVGTLGGLEVVGHAAVEGEHGGGGTNLGTHVTDGGHTSARERLETRAEVLDDSTSSTLDGKDASNLEDNVYSKVSNSASLKA